MATKLERREYKIPYVPGSDYLKQLNHSLQGIYPVDELTTNLDPTGHLLTMMLHPERIPDTNTGWNHYLVHVNENSFLLSIGDDPVSFQCMICPVPKNIKKNELKLFCFIKKYKMKNRPTLFLGTDKIHRESVLIFDNVKNDQVEYFLPKAKLFGLADPK
jgi:hypothetical protein